MSTAPEVITRYLKAADHGDYDTLVACFTEDGTVLDEGQTYGGRNEIRGWRESLRSQWKFTTTVTGREPDGDGRYIVRTHVEGNFPGGVADLTYRFTLAGDKIARLTILQ
jgi:ketosteroid isomerase-like protein